jgi:hypothetical protein
MYGYTECAMGSEGRWQSAPLRVPARGFAAMEEDWFEGIRFLTELLEEGRVRPEGPPRTNSRPEAPEEWPRRSKFNYAADEFDPECDGGLP